RSRFQNKNWCLFSTNRTNILSKVPEPRFCGVTTKLFLANEFTGLILRPNITDVTLHPLNAISPVDGRYFDTLKSLSAYFSELALIRYRVRIEVEYLLALTSVVPELERFPQTRQAEVRNIFSSFSEADGLRVKEIEKTTNHDVKAVE